jgi:hypothetical protein
MKTVRIILIAAILFSYVGCNAQSSKKTEDKEFQVLLNRFKTIKPPLNYKKMKQRISSMTKEEAIRFLHKTEKDLVYISEEIGEDDVIYTTQEEHTAGCDFKYLLNDSIYILCTREWLQKDIGEPFGTIDITKVCLNSFTMRGELIKQCIVGEQFAYNSDWISFILLDKTHLRVYYYEDNNTREKEGFLSTVHYINYEITGNGKFIEKYKSDKTYLKSRASFYCSFDYSGKNKMEEDDPMNEYNF